YGLQLDSLVADFVSFSRPLPNLTALRYGMKRWHDLGRLLGVGQAVVLLLRDTFSPPNALAQVNVSGIRHPVWIRLATTDVRVIRGEFFRREYGEEIAVNPRVIIDAGANIGLTAVNYANRYPSSRIIAVESERGNFDVLQRN